MLAIGGDTKIFSSTDQDLTPHGLSIFDMTELTWNREGSGNYHYDAGAAPYKSPRIIEEWYRNKNLSSLPWESEEIKNMFLAQPVNFDGPTSAPTATSPTDSATSGKESSPSKIGPIVGGAVGGLSFLGILAGLIYYFRFRRSKKSSPNKIEPGGTETRHEFKQELSAENQITEMDVPRGELVTNSNAWELDAAARERHYAQAYELEGHAAARGTGAG